MGCILVSVLHHVLLVNDEMLLCGRSILVFFVHYSCESERLVRVEVCCLNCIGQFDDLTNRYLIFQVCMRR